MKRFYAPTYLDESMTHPDKKGRKFPTGRLRGMLFVREFSKMKGGKIKAARSIVPFSWDRDTEEAKVAALAKAIEGMEEIPGLEENPPLTWVPDVVREALQCA